MNNTLFTGRAKLLERIENVIRKDALEMKVLVVTGMGGLGKSEICLKVVNDMRREYAMPPCE
jgi:predicted ATP-dependent serine protease